MSLNKFKILYKLGDGAYSIVYKVRRIVDGKEYALKKVKLTDLSEKERQNALNEVQILASIRHSNIIGYKEVFIDEDTSSLCIIMEFANDGDLLQKINAHQQKGLLFQESQIWNIFIQLVKGLKALHDLDIYHRDLKSANIFLYADGTCKLGDLNVSKKAKLGFLTTQTGTPFYASPEVWKDLPYDSKSDIWSLGCVLYEIITLRTPFRGDDMDTMYRKIVKGVYPRIPAYFSIELSQIIKLLLQVNPSLRLSCDKILLLPLVSKFLEEKHFIQMNEGIPFLLKTIRMTKKMNLLSESLPKPNYDSLKMIFVNKKQFFKTIDNGKTFRDDNYTESSDKDFAKKLLNLIGTKKGSVLPRINKSKLIEDHNKRYNDIAPLYQEEIFFIKAIGINPKIKNKKPNVSKSCQNNTKLFTDESQTELKESRTKLENKKDDDQIKQNKKLIKIFLPKI